MVIGLMRTESRGKHVHIRCSGPDGGTRCYWLELRPRCLSPRGRLREHVRGHDGGLAVEPRIASSTVGLVPGRHLEEHQ